MSSLAAAVNTFFALLGIWAEGLGALARLGRMGFAAWRGPGLRAGLVPQLLAPGGQRLVFATLRAFQPTLALRRVLVKAYPNTGTAVVTRREDVIEVLRRDEDFEVVYEPRMREITAGENFFLGMQPGWPYTRDVSAMRLAARRSDVADIVAPRAAALASEIVAGSGGALNLPGDLALRVSADMVGTYFGTPGPSEREMIDWTTVMFWFLFGDLGADPQVGARARQAAADCRAYLDAAIAARKAAPTEADDVLNRCLALQAAGTPGMDDLGIRNNLIGLLIGAVPTISKAATLALDELLRRPEALRVAQASARAGDDALMEAHVWEALRFNPHNPVIYRRAVRDATIAASSLRARRIPKGTLVFAANHSAMFDGLDVPDPRSFRTDRPWETYIHWGYGLHACFGDAINRAVIPAILKPLLARPGLRATGPRDDGGTPFPVSLPLTFD